MKNISPQLFLLTFLICLFCSSNLSAQAQKEKGSTTTKEKVNSSENSNNKNKATDGIDYEDEEVNEKGTTATSGENKDVNAIWAAYQRKLKNKEKKGIKKPMPNAKKKKEKELREM
ncbi:hypothetical protein [Aquimarina brevivitae]|uniref:Uncharacterized protein n=1 Tax=Aquimarina brevivitae TaxID=323412 RepID=A0A4Q7P1E8_9FLAO|nr:hypothetical protein [Aquimarina brevivitae]RZS93534.1 hypothetical protein EV197_2114 [Aquimarina brevivitae]